VRRGQQVEATQRVREAHGLRARPGACPGRRKAGPPPRTRLAEA
jgi:hypothetical protein